MLAMQQWLKKETSNDSQKGAAKAKHKHKKQAVAVRDTNM